MHRFHYLLGKEEGFQKVAMSMLPLSSTSARGKLVYRDGRVMALLHGSEDLVVIDVSTGEQLGCVPGGGGQGCQEVLYDVSEVPWTSLTIATSP